MIIYHIYDHDPMDGSMGADYLADTFVSREAAEKEVARRNNAWYLHWERFVGKDRCDREPWLWKHARIVETATKD